MFAYWRGVDFISVIGTATNRLPNALIAQSETNLLAVVAHVDQFYRTATGVGRRVIVGDSMGGEAAIRLSLKHWKSHLFSAALATDPGNPKGLRVNENNFLTL